tara:strand:+ start:122 stop:238 length:117 start_codon:yes stop_codon:yes gene_type:complete
LVPDLELAAINMDEVKEESQQSYTKSLDDLSHVLNKDE